MRLRALGNINSGQYATGDVFDIGELEAVELIDAGAAEAFEGESVNVTAENNDSSESEPTTPDAPAEPEASATEAPLAPQTPSPLEPTLQTPSDAQPAGGQGDAKKTKQPTQSEIDAALAAAEGEKGAAAATTIPIS